LWRNAPGHHDNFGPLKTLPASFLIDRNGKVVKQFVGRLEPAIWDDIAEMVLQ
jgi:glutathione peroxidase-family protein